MNTLLKIFQGAQLVAAVAGLAMDQAVKMKNALELDPDYRVSIEQLGALTEAEIADTKHIINGWRKSQGMPPLGE